MNTRKEYPTFEELWTCCAQEESRISEIEKHKKKYDDQSFTVRFKNFRNKGSLVQGGSQIKRKIFQKYNASTVEIMVTTRVIFLN
jgi:hypothetical protein